ncbi:MAG: carboxyl-terminal processing protease [Gemmatimonadales bacterium]|nr:carboxyl-terminal processing protease [Gemmatimonadales bacterium]
MPDAARGGIKRLAFALLLWSVPAAAEAQSSSYEELQRFSAVLNHIRVNYPDSVAYNGLVRAAIDGMLRSLDPHSWFASREDYEKLSALDRGDLAVTGIVFEFADGVPTVLSYSRKSPAEKAGVLPGDRILRVDGVPVVGMTSKSVALRLAGEKGSKVTVGLERGPRLEPDTFSVQLKRAFLESRSVSIVRMLNPETGYVRLDEFGETGADEVRKAVRQLRSSKARQLILDLRGNPGGIVTEAVDLAAQFLPGKTLVFTTRGRKKVLNEDYRTKGQGEFVDLPLIVLVDGGSASASEAFAGSLQDHDRALIVGRRSFGKALMQTGFLVPSGFVQLTIGHVLTPSGRFIQRRYRGFAIEQYYAFAGTAGDGADTLTVFRTDNGRPVRGGGGIAPDLAVPAPVSPPAWWSAAADSGYDNAVADSVALTLAADAPGRAEWIAGTQAWEMRLLPPFLDRVRARLAVTARPDSATGADLARRLAARAAFVRWPPDAGSDLMLASDPDVRAALASFPRLAQLLSAPRP